MLFRQARRQSFNSSEKSVTLTETKPFNLRSEERGRAKQALLEQRLMAQRRQVKVYVYVIDVTALINHCDN